MQEREVALRSRKARQPGRGGPAPPATSQVSQVLGLQRSAGNAAVARLLDGPASAPDASRVAGLAKQVGTASRLRAALGADPALAQEIAAYFASGAEDPALNELMAGAFATAPVSGAVISDKDPTDPALPLPPERKGNKALDKGRMKWTLKPTSHIEARIDVDFKPDETKVEAKNVSFGQTVVNQVGAIRAYPGGTAKDPAKTKATFEPFEEATTHKRIDHLPATENDPFYGAEWDQAGKKWKKEPGGMDVGSSTKGGTSKSATLNDTPSFPPAREGLGDAKREFETVPMVLETREPLGSLRWGFNVKDEPNAPIELTGAEDADCTDTPSDSWGAAMDKFYEAKYAEILDEFDVAKADLKPDHKTKLDSVATKLKANPVLKAQLGGAADLTGDEKFNQALSLKRATAARDYLVGKGIETARLELQSYGFDWARVETEQGKSEGKNRRVQIWLH